MKKIFAIMMVICLMVTVLCFSACAADEPAEDTYDRVSSDAFDEDSLEGIDEMLPDLHESADGWGYRFASIMGEGSPAMIVALLALIASITSIFLTVSLYKKSIAPKGTSKTEDEE